MPNNLVFNNVASDLVVQIYGKNGSNVLPIATDASGNLMVGTVTAIFDSGTVTVQGGTIDVVSALTAGTVTVSGGTIDALTAGTVTVSGGTVDVVSALTAGTVTVSGGTIDALTAGTVTVSGGTVDVVSALTAGTVTVSGGTIDALTAGTVTVSGGTVDVVSALTAGTVTVSGGTIQTEPLFVTDNVSVSVSNAATVDALIKDTSTQKVFSYWISNIEGTGTVDAWLQISPVDSATYYVNDSTTVYQVGPGEKTVLIPEKFLNFTKLQLINESDTATVLCYYNAQT